MDGTANPLIPGRAAQRTALSKDYVEHVRGVHLTLVGTSIILAFLAFSPSPSQYDEAKGQLVSIQRIDRDKVAALVYSKYEEALKVWNHSESVRLLTGDFTTLSVPGYDKTFALSFSPPDQGFTHFAAEDTLGFDPLDKEGLSDYHSFRSVREFKTFWDALHDNRWLPVPLRPPAKIFTHPMESKDNYTPTPFEEATASQGLPVSLSKEPPTGARLTFYLTRCLRSVKASVAVQSPSANCRYMYLARSADTKTWFALPVEEETRIEVEPQRIFLEQNKNWVRGKFESSFRSLNDLTGNFQDMDLETLRKVLEAEENAKGESFEAVGIKFPSATTKWAGFVVLFGIQLYLYLLLREPIGSAEGSEIAWIGLHKSRVAKGLVLCTIVALPSLAFAAMAFRNMTGRIGAWRIIGLVCSVVALATVSIVTWAALRGLNCVGPESRSIEKTDAMPAS